MVNWRPVNSMSVTAFKQFTVTISCGKAKPMDSCMVQSQDHTQDLTMCDSPRHFQVDLLLVWTPKIRLHIVHVRGKKCLQMTEKLILINSIQTASNQARKLFTKVRSSNILIYHHGEFGVLFCISGLLHAAVFGFFERLVPFVLVVGYIIWIKANHSSGQNSRTCHSSFGWPTKTYPLLHCGVWGWNSAGS